MALTGDDLMQKLQALERQESMLLDQLAQVRGAKQFCRQLIAEQCGGKREGEPEEAVEANGRAD